MEEVHRERLKKVALVTIPLALGAIAVKNIRDKKTGSLRHISYWEASRTFILDLIEDAKSTPLKITRVTGDVIHGPGGIKDVADIKLHNNFDYTDDEVAAVEDAFTPIAEGKKSQQTPLQTD